MVKATRLVRALTAMTAVVLVGLIVVQSASAALGARTLRYGARGYDVRQLQSLLRQLGYHPAVTGWFGPQTATAVRGWERRAHERADGIVTRWQVLRMRRSAVSSLSSANGGTRVGTTNTTSSTGYVFPVRGPHSFGTSINRYGAPRSGHTHMGQDILARMGTPLANAHAGRVTHRASGGAAGNYVVIAASDGTDLVYMHLQTPAVVRVGQWVSAGRFIGRVGQTGDATTPHLHFEVWTAHWWAGGHAFDPLPRLRTWDAAT